MGIKVPRTRAGNTWTEARYWAFIRSALRGAWSRYPVKHQVLKAARRTIKKGTKNTRATFEYPCADCGGWFEGKEVQVDHIKPTGSLRTYEDLPGFVSTLLCEADNLQIMCKPCHQKKTNEERKNGKGT